MAMSKDFADSMMEIFVVETNDFIAELEKILMQDEEDGSSIKSAVPEIFRIMHTIKSSSAMMSLDNISKMAHTIEDVFFYIRENKPQNVDYTRLADIVLDCVDYIKRNMDSSVNENPEVKASIARKFLEELKSGVPAKEDGPERIVASPKKMAEIPDTSSGAHVKTFKFHVTFKENTQLIGMRAFELLSKLQRVCRQVTSIPGETTGEGEDYIRKNGIILTAVSEGTDEELMQILHKSPFINNVQFINDDRNSELGEAFIDRRAAGSNGGTEAATWVPKRKSDSPRARAAGTLFANVAIPKLNALMDIAGEILTAEMNLESSFHSNDSEKVEKNQSALRALILQLQEAALSTRMVTLEDTFHKLRLTVRDVSRKQQKEVEFETFGEKIEVDRVIVDKIVSPLIHIIRNSMDHGIESAEERIALGKPEKGSIVLRAVTEGRNVIISVTDDGKGMDRKRILRKAIEKNLTTSKAVPNLMDDEIFAFTFLPGFSTSDTVTEISGRGVGMDVVQDSVNQLHGKIVITSASGEGTTTSLSIPLSMAIIDSLVLRVYDDVCTIPLDMVNEIFRLEDDASISEVNGKNMVLYRGSCYRIIDLFDFLDAKEKANYDEGVMIILRHHSKKCVVFVNEVLRRQSVVVKPVPSMFKSIKGISGCVILREGRVSFMLDADEIIGNPNL